MLRFPKPDSFDLKDENYYIIMLSAKPEIIGNERC